MHDDGEWAGLQRAPRALLVVDVVESVRLLRAGEAGAIRRWMRFVDEVRQQVLPAAHGQMVKSLGDGMLLAFDRAPQALAAALEIRRRIAPHNLGLAEGQHIRLRQGLHLGEVVVDALDVYGSAVDLAARLAGIAEPGDILLSAAAREQLTDGLDAGFEDLGDCWLKHIDQPVRCARVCRTEAHRTVRLHDPSLAAEDTVAVAVLPFTARGSPLGADDPLGDLIADDLISVLSRLPPLRVISRLSSAAFRGREVPLAQMGRLLGARYLVHGSVAIDGDRARLSAQLVVCADGRVLGADTLDTPKRDLVFGPSEAAERLARELAQALINAEIHAACTRPLPTLSSYTVLIGAMARLHSLSRTDFERSHAMLQFLCERHRALATPRAWLGLWHVLRVGQGWSPDPAEDASRARQSLAAALDLQDDHALALAVDGLVSAYVHKDMDTAGLRYDAAIAANPNEGLAWLYRAAWHAYREEGDRAVQDAMRAQKLSPLDPMRYYYDNFTSIALLAAGDLPKAIDYGHRSLRANRMHAPTLRVLAIAHAQAGEMAQARDIVQQMLRLEPNFTVTAFRRRFPGQRPGQLEPFCDALAEAGLPP